MFDWLLRRKPYETHEAAQAAVLRKARRLNPPPEPNGTVDMTAAVNPFLVDVGPSDGCAGHHSGSSHCDVAPSCDIGTSHH